MSTWQEFPLRPAGAIWPGLNTRGGALDNSTGQLEEGSVGMLINEGDILEKRKGLVRGLSEHFTGVVCGLFKYTDDCGVEWILVADESLISIRQPFVIPTFTQSDAYPFDSFGTDFTGLGNVDPDDWRNLTRYTLRSDKLVEVSTSAAMSGGDLASTDWLRWFKDASNLSYKVRIEYEFGQNPTEQHQGVVIKGVGDLTAGAYLQAEIVHSQAGIYEVRMFHMQASRVLTQVATETIVGGQAPATGFLTLRYTRDLSAPIDSQFIVSVEVNPVGGPGVVKAVSINGLQDADLGQVSATGVGHRLGTLVLDNGVKVVDGGPV